MFGYALLTGVPPFPDVKMEEECYKNENMNADYDRPEFKDVSAEAIALVKRLIVFDPEQRLSSRDIFADPWIKAAAGAAEREASVVEETKKSHIRMSLVGMEAQQYCRRTSSLANRSNCVGAEAGTKVKLGASSPSPKFGESLVVGDSTDLSDMV